VNFFYTIIKEEGQYLARAFSMARTVFSTRFLSAWLKGAKVNHARWDGALPVILIIG